MIYELYIKNCALIEEMRVEFGKQLNILTGETGSGKSIILGALTFVSAVNMIGPS
ncbi:MAG: AAA family ATPase [Peptostreptococcus anaerobius]